MTTKRYEYLSDGFEGVLYETESGDDRVLMVIQGLKGLELPEKYAEFFASRGYSALAVSYYGGKGQKRICARCLSNSLNPRATL